MSKSTRPLWAGTQTIRCSANNIMANPTQMVNVWYFYAINTQCLWLYFDSIDAERFVCNTYVFVLFISETMSGMHGVVVRETQAPHEKPHLWPGAHDPPLLGGAWVQRPRHQLRPPPSGSLQTMPDMLRCGAAIRPAPWSGEFSIVRPPYNFIVLQECTFVTAKFINKLICRSGVRKR